MSPGTSPAARLMLGLLRETRVAVAVSAVCGLGFQGGLILLPWCLERALDRGITPGDGPALRTWVLVLVAVSAGLTLSEAGMRWFVSLSADRAGNRLVVRTGRRLLGLDAAAAGRFGHGDLVTRATRDVDAVREWLGTVPSLLSGLVGFGTVVVVLSRTGGGLGRVALAVLPLLVLVNLWYPAWYARADAAVSTAHGERAGAVEDLLTASTAVRGLGGEDVLVRRHHRRSAALTTDTLALARVAADWSAYAPAIPWLAVAAGLAVGGPAVLDGDFTIGGLVAFAAWMALLARQVQMLTERARQAGHAYVSSVRIAEVLDARPELAPPADPERLPERGRLVGPGIAVEPGEFVAVTGPTGSGKTTLLRQLARLRDGDVSFGGVELARADPGQLRRRITLVPQRPTLLSGTLADNLRLGLADRPDDAELLAACRAAAVDDVVDSWPDGLDTVLGEGGRTVSGGQLQRFALARALLRRAPVLLLDDVTSAVDAATEERILARLPAWAPGTTIVAVTSRPAVLAAADRVVTRG